MNKIPLRKTALKAEDARKPFDLNEAKVIGDKLKVNWDRIAVKDFMHGLNVETEHGRQNPKTNVSNDDPIITGKIAWVHLLEDPEYYQKLKEVEGE